MGRVRDFGGMLRFAESFNQNLGQWTVDPGANTDNMLFDAYVFQKANAPWASAVAYKSW